MSNRTDLGRVVSVHGTSPVFLQRAAIIAILSFFFFMATLLVFYVQQQVMYFILSTAFLIIYIFTMIGWVMQKKNVVSIHEDGIAFRQFTARWDEIKSVKVDKRTGINIVKANNESATLGNSLDGVDAIAIAIKRNLGQT